MTRKDQINKIKIEDKKNTFEMVDWKSRVIDIFGPYLYKPKIKKKII